MNYRLTAKYTIRSHWFLDLDLNLVADWYVRWDKLYVKFNAHDEDYVEIQPDMASDDDIYAIEDPEEIDCWKEEIQLT